MLLPSATGWVMLGVKRENGFGDHILKPVTDNAINSTSQDLCIPLHSNLFQPLMYLRKECSDCSLQLRVGWLRSLVCENVFNTRSLSDG